MIDPNKPSQEKLLYEELAIMLVRPSGKLALAPVVELYPNLVQPQLPGWESAEA